MGNAWLERRQLVQQATLNASEETMMQFCLDVVCLILHEEFGFGARRLERFFEHYQTGVNEWHDALQQWECSGDLRYRLDEKLAGILGDKFACFAERYTYVKPAPKIGTGKEPEAKTLQNRTEKRAKAKTSKRIRKGGKRK